MRRELPAMESVQATGVVTGIGVLIIFLFDLPGSWVLLWGAVSVPLAAWLRRPDAAGVCGSGNRS